MAIQISGTTVINNSRNLTNIGSISASGNITTTAAITASGNITAYSDESLKDNIKQIEGAVEKVCALRGVEFDRNDLEENPHQIGVIAQEVEKIIPEVVLTHEDGIKSVAYGSLVGLLIEAVKEQQEQINELKSK